MAGQGEAHLRLSDADKEELFTEFLIRYAELDKEDKRESSARNNSAMKDLTSYWQQKTHHVGPHEKVPEDLKYLYREFDGRKYFAADGIYNAYLGIRKVVPYAVGAKRGLQEHEIAGSHPGYKRTYVMDPEKDREEATLIGKKLIDVLLDYLKEA